jgi:hypothetical protein
MPIFVIFNSEGISLCFLGGVCAMMGQCVLCVIQSDQKVSVHLMITLQKVTSNVQSVPRHSPDIIDTPNSVLEDCVQYSTVRIPNVLCHVHLQLIDCFLYCNRQVHRHFLINLYCHLHNRVSRKAGIFEIPLLKWSVRQSLLL